MSTLSKKDNGKKVLTLLNEINLTINKNLKSKFCSYGFTVPQITVLAVLSQNKKMKISDISKLIHSTNSTVSGIVDRLEKQGFIKRVKSQEDRRVVFVELDHKFLDMKEEIDKEMASYLDGIFKNIDEEKTLSIISGLENLKAILLSND
ncbi:MarR family winged helix-turn-helix transcriptional regulator [Desnuesiella massiliensis]|uniref:MarR family winged helix-turn-helix transcriptional regulator n=1 Tax=Desnuesiella massiliensis TaxID=1650662 RepID=UPI0006E3500F|nr:MarR family transcriptional regulator [Desnuesiella massiliensis]